MGIKFNNFEIKKQSEKMWKISSAALDNHVENVKALFYTKVILGNSGIYKGLNRGIMKERRGLLGRLSRGSVSKARSQRFHQSHVRYG